MGAVREMSKSGWIPPGFPFSTSHPEERVVFRKKGMGAPTSHPRNSHPWSSLGFGASMEGTLLSSFLPGPAVGPIKPCSAPLDSGAVGQESGLPGPHLKGAGPQAPTPLDPAPEGMSMLAMGTVSPLRTPRMLRNGSRTSPLKLKPKMASTTSSYSSSISTGCGGREEERTSAHSCRALCRTRLSPAPRRSQSHTPFSHSNGSLKP